MNLMAQIKFECDTPRTADTLEKSLQRVRGPQGELRISRTGSTVTVELDGIIEVDEAIHILDEIAKITQEIEGTIKKS
ncbi:MAG: hypothetical protein ACTSSJ_05085 [Candidatus Odinarchaeia archaeon]